jgi:RNA ligase
MKLGEYVDKTALLTQMAEGFIKAQEWDNLVIFNYTNKAQYENHWTTETKRCRGLIIDRNTDEIIARPFEKFFNWGQVDRDMLPREGPIRVQDKADGSLGILYRDPSTGELGIATRGSFTSDQAVHATELLRTRYADFEPREGVTYLFEIIYPENRIVVDYGGQDDLVLLDIIDNNTGLSWIDHHFMRSTWPGPVVERFDYPFIEDVLNTEPRPGREGFVITYPNGFRVKVKQDEYVRLHRLLTGVSTKTIWEILANDGDITEIIDRVPDEYYHWVRNTVAGLQKDFNQYASMAYQTYCALIGQVPNHLEPGSPEHRKTFAMRAKDSEYKAVLFRLYDNKDADDVVWKVLKPEYSKPFWNANEDVA